MANHPQNSEFKLPMPPPALHTRSTNEYYDQPTTPLQALGFVSPTQTPQGSPSKHQAPPGAFDLPNVFDNAMKLISTNNGSPSRNTRSQAPGSPGKNGGAFSQEIDFPDYSHSVAGAAPGSPKRQGNGNEENAAPGSPTRPGVKTQPSYITSAQQGRQEAYRTRDEPKTLSRGLSPEEMEKLQKPAVKRLANVTQLCEYTQVV